ncbi:MULTISPECIES: alpha/beta fold hydrolase [unclassified Streptomyces]|uniref:alpha/beta fold hydrolase n=1 Tax=unclassified Streptomyces TaxID=2593676 RepID=UPI0033B2C84F
MTWSERSVVREGVRIACRDRGGSGIPVVLLHGLAGHAGEWDPVARGLSPRHRVVAVDQRGHGAGERHPRDVSRAAYVADVVAVLEQLGLRRPVLAGQSLGGRTAMLAAGPLLPPAVLRARRRTGHLGRPRLRDLAATGPAQAGAGGEAVRHGAVLRRVHRRGRAARHGHRGGASGRARPRGGGRRGRRRPTAGLGDR